MFLNSSTYNLDMSEPVTKRVAIIGAGPGGLVSIKQCRDDGIDVVCFEATDNLGGLWCYRDQGASVTKSTIINTSKELNAISDFPPPTESANYFHNEETVSDELTNDRLHSANNPIFYITVSFTYSSNILKHTLNTTSSPKIFAITQGSWESRLLMTTKRLAVGL